jgi:hypothetical protein
MIRLKVRNHAFAWAVLSACSTSENSPEADSAVREHVPAAGAVPADAAKREEPPVACDALLHPDHITESCGVATTSKSFRLEGRTSQSLCARTFEAQGVSTLRFTLSKLRSDGPHKVVAPPKEAFEPARIDGLGSDALWYSQARGPARSIAILRVVVGDYHVELEESMRKKTAEHAQDELACDKDHLVALARGIVGRLESATAEP